MIHKSPTALKIVRKFDPTALNLDDLNRRLRLNQKNTTGRPDGGVLPVDECIRELCKRKLFKNPENLPRRFGGCPSAAARWTIFEAARHAEKQHARKIDIKVPLTEQLKQLKADIPKLHALNQRVLARVDEVESLLHEGGITLSSIDNLSIALSFTDETFAKAERATKHLHVLFAQNSDDVWRRSFVQGLFVCWWWLTSKDPTASLGPCQRFITSAWCSLSDDASPDDVDWTNAIKGALSHCRPGEWRVTPNPVAKKLDETPSPKFRGG